MSIIQKTIIITYFIFNDCNNNAYYSDFFDFNLNLF